MNIVHSNGQYQIYGENIDTYKELPVGSYDVNFNKMTGFCLSKHPSLKVSEDKVYGNSEEKVKKILKSYAESTRNFGVLLSGQKGIGKSLFVRILAVEAEKHGIPVLIVNSAIPGLPNFISSINQDCVVVLDEFEKTFAETDGYSPQEEILPLLDGIDGGHKLFIATCNELKNVNQYLLNRPGRFHYHFTIGTPTQEEIREYMTDKVKAEYKNEIEKVVNLSCIVDLPYDCLRAIAFELNQGYSLQETMNDLNITQSKDYCYKVTAYLDDGSIYICNNRRINFYTTDSFVNELYGKDGKSSISVYFNPTLASMRNNEFSATEGIKLCAMDEDDFWYLPEEFRKQEAERMNQRTVTRLTFTKIPEYMPQKYVIN